MLLSLFSCTGKITNRAKRGKFFSPQDENNFLFNEWCENLTGFEIAQNRHRCPQILKKNIGAPKFSFFSRGWQPKKSAVPPLTPPTPATAVVISPFNHIGGKNLHSKLFHHYGCTKMTGSQFKIFFGFHYGLVGVQLIYSFQNPQLPDNAIQMIRPLGAWEVQEKSYFSQVMLFACHPLYTCVRFGV